MLKDKIYKTLSSILIGGTIIFGTAGIANIINENIKIEECTIANYNENEDIIIINNNNPTFSNIDLDNIDLKNSFEYYSDLDELGRCGYAIANIGIDIMPTENREAINSVKPTGWHSVKYENINGKYLYNRCHLIGYQLTAENANKRNLITGTRYLNVDLMLPYENMIADYIKETNNHVLYKVTPIFEGNNLVATGVQLEALSIEDNGNSIKFNVFLYNIQPGINIDYSDGSSSLSEFSYIYDILYNYKIA